MNLIRLENMRSHNRAARMIEYIINKQIALNYDWFYLLPDTTYTKGFKLYELVTHISVGFGLVMGRKMKEQPEVCRFEAGILLSHTSIVQIAKLVFSVCKKIKNADLLHCKDTEIYCCLR